MKHIKIILSGIFVLLLVAAQPLLAQDDKELPVTLTKAESSGFVYEKVFDLPSVSKEQAYDRVKQWVLNNLKTVDNNNAFDDKEKGNINTSTTLILDQVKGRVGIPLVGFKISFSFKENKMKINASQFVCQYEETTPFDNTKLPKKIRESIYNSFDQKFAALIESAKTAASSNNDKW